MRDEEEEDEDDSEEPFTLADYEVVHAEMRLELRLSDATMSDHIQAIMSWWMSNLQMQDHRNDQLMMEYGVQA